MIARLTPKAGPAAGRRELNVGARRQRILNAARHLITKGGLAALSMRKLAKEAGLSVTTLYNLFGVREEILQALVMDAIDQMDLVLERDAPLDNPIDRCRAIIVVSVQHMVDNDAVFRPMVIAAHQNLIEGGRIRNEVARRAARMQSRAIAIAIEQGLLTDLLDPDQLGRQIYHGYEFASIQWSIGQLDAAGFAARALYGLDLALLAVANDRVRAELQANLRRLEKTLGSNARSGARRAKKQR